MFIDLLYDSTHYQKIFFKLFKNIYIFHHLYGKFECNI